MYFPNKPLPGQVSTILSEKAVERNFVKAYDSRQYVIEKLKETGQ
jgi:hypothetical protein